MNALVTPIHTASGNGDGTAIARKNAACSAAAAAASSTRE
jgi:hypothetical protein